MSFQLRWSQGDPSAAALPPSPTGGLWGLPPQSVAPEEHCQEKPVSIMDG